jgi:hypothetical protein
MRSDRVPFPRSYFCLLALRAVVPALLICLSLPIRHTILHSALLTIYAYKSSNSSVQPEVPHFSSSPFLQRLPTNWPLINKERRSNQPDSRTTGERLIVRKAGDKKHIAQSEGETQSKAAENWELGARRKSGEGNERGINRKKRDNWRGLQIKAHRNEPHLWYMKVICGAHGNFKRRALRWKRYIYIYTVFTTPAYFAPPNF